MNLIEYYKEKGLSIEGERQINMIVGCIVYEENGCPSCGSDNFEERELESCLLMWGWKGE